MKTLNLCAALLFGAGLVTTDAIASTVAQREYKRGYEDCLAGRYDQDRHGSSYKRGCRAAEGSGKGTGSSISSQADPGHMRSVCNGAVHGRFGSYLRMAKITNVEHQDFGWGVYGTAIMDDGAFADFVCMFSSTGQFKRVNSGDPVGGVHEENHEEYCPVDVSEADRYKYPGCD